MGECLAEIDFKNVNSLRKRAGREESGGKRIQRKGVEIFKQWKKEVTKAWRVSLGKVGEKNREERGKKQCNCQKLQIQRNTDVFKGKGIKT